MPHFPVCIKQYVHTEATLCCNTGVVAPNITNGRCDEIMIVMSVFWVGDSYIVFWPIFFLLNYLNV